MFGSCSKRLKSLVPFCKIVGDSEIVLCILQSSQLSQKSFSLSISSSLAAEKCKVRPQEQKLEEEHSFKVSYLIKSCGLTPDVALNVSKRINFKTPERPDSVLGLLRDRGFSKTDISKIVKTRPSLLLLNAEKILLPKLDFYRSIGISAADLSRVVVWNHCLLTRSLENFIIPCYDTLKRVLIHDEKVAKFFVRSPWIILDSLARNVSILRALGMRENSISVLLTCHPNVACIKTSKFEKVVEKAISIGFNPSKMIFTIALHMVSSVGGSSWARKLKLYNRCGWTENDFLSAFRKDPCFVGLSEKKFMGKMDVFVKKMGLQPADVARSPIILRYNLEKKIIPRCSVIKLLLSNGLLKERPSMSYVLTQSDEAFLNRFVTKYQENVPLLLDVFNRKLSFL